MNLEGGRRVERKGFVLKNAEALSGFVRIRGLRREWLWKGKVMSLGLYETGVGGSSEQVLSTRKSQSGES